MVSREDLFVRIVLPHLLFTPVVAYYVRRDATRRDHPHPTRTSLLYGLLGIPGVVLYEIRKEPITSEDGEYVGYAPLKIHKRTI